MHILTSILCWYWSLDKSPRLGISFLQVLAVIAISLAMGDGDFQVAQGVQVNAEDVGSCQDCTCLEGTCYCKATACKEHIDGNRM
jgi:hypothetical protein